MYSSVVRWPAMRIGRSEKKSVVGLTPLRVIVPFELWVAQLDDDIDELFLVVLKDGERRIGGIGSETVLSFAPHLNVLFGCQVARDAHGTVGEKERGGTYTLKGDRPLLEENALRILHKQELRHLRLLLGLTGFR